MIKFILKCLNKYKIGIIQIKAKKIKQNSIYKIDIKNIYYYYNKLYIIKN